MSDFKIVADSSSDMLNIKKVPFESAPLKVRTDEKNILMTAILMLKIW